jgi:uncharacterized membrane protein YphA (DoxX/SURF4 family)
MLSLRSARFRRFALLFTRFGLAATLLSGVADRFGAWGRHGTAHASWGDMQHFAARAQTVLPQAPAWLALMLAWLATVLDSALGLGLLIGVRTRTMALSAAVWLFVYAIAVFLSPGGVHATFAYGLLGLSGASLLVATVADDL